MQQLPSELCDRQAVGLSRAIASGDVSPIDLIESCIARIKSCNPQINAVVTDNFVQARLAAAESARIVEVGGPIGPLHGLPVLIKDLTHTKDLRTTFGSLAFEDHVPERDDIIVARLKGAGAIVLGKTNTPEFGVGGNTVNKVFGATSNPHNPNLTAGGSSGGSAAALAAGMVPLATGSDLGGSLRIPAAFCGVVGFRPSPGEIPSAPRTLGFSPLWTDGPMARTVADTELLFQAVRGADRIDPRSFGQIDTVQHQPKDFSKVRIGFSTDLGFAPVDPMIKEMFEHRKSIIRNVFSNAFEADVDLSAAEAVFPVLRAEELLSALGDIAEQHGDKMGTNVSAGISEAKEFSFEERVLAGKKHTRIYQDFHDTFNQIDFLICPTTGVSPFPLSQNHPADVGGVPMKTYYEWYGLTWALSLLGCPVISLPFGEDINGMPFGIQIVGPRGGDDRFLAFAKFVESAILR